MSEQKKAAISASFTNGLLDAATRYSENPKVDMAALNEAAAKRRREAGAMKMALNNANMKAQAAEARRNDNQTEMFGDHP